MIGEIPCLSRGPQRTVHIAFEAVKLYELGKLSSGRAAELAGVTRVEFLLALGRYQGSPFALDAETLAQDSLNA